MIFESDKEYYADREYLTNSSLKLLHKSPTLFYQWLNRQDSNLSSSALEIGKAFHALSLEGIVNFVGFEGTRRGKEYMEFCKENDGTIILSKKEADLIHKMYDVLRKCPEVNDLMYSDSDLTSVEVPSLSVWDGIKIKGKADMVVERDFSEKFLVDIKTTGGTLEEFRRGAKYMGYDQQAAIYCKLFDVDTFYFVAITKSYPHEIGIYKSSQRFLQDGIIKAQEGIDKYKRLFLDNKFNPYKASEVGIL